MLNQALARSGAGRMQRAQRGVVMIIALIVLVAMTLAGIALMRSVDTTTVITGNLAFQQAATTSGDTGIETAATWLQTNNVGTTLYASNLAAGYSAARQDPGATQSWDDFWNNVLLPGGQVVALPPDAAGNVASYAIHRLCNTVGDPVTPGVNCSVAQSASGASTSSKSAGSVQLKYNSAVYYRITARIVGPRNTVSYVQAVVAQ